MNLSRMRESQLTKVRARSIGFIFQTFNLIPTLNAAENVEVALVPLGVSGAARGPAPSRRCGPSGWATGCATCRRSCPAASSSGSRSPARWSRSPACCSPTSPPATSTREPGTRSSTCWRTCGSTRPDHGAGHPRQHGGRPGAAARPDERRPAHRHAGLRPGPPAGLPVRRWAERQAHRPGASGRQVRPPALAAQPRVPAQATCPRPISGPCPLTASWLANWVWYRLAYRPPAASSSRAGRAR